jgi:hypothetical protein
LPKTLRKCSSRRKHSNTPLYNTIWTTHTHVYIYTHTYYSTSPPVFFQPSLSSQLSTEAEDDLRISCDIMRIQI